MIHLKKFNESTEKLWKEISYDEYLEYSTIEEFTQREINQIEDVVRPTERSLDFVYDNQMESIDIRRRDFYLYERLDINLTIHKIRDDWFIVSDKSHLRPAYYGNYYICDDIVGLTQLLNIIIRSN